MTVVSDLPSDARLPPEGNVDTARLIYFERYGRWALALGRALGPLAARVHETRTLSHCWAALGGSPASFVVAELAAPQAEQLLDRLVRLEREFPLARVAVVAEREMAPWEWLVRQAGAIHFTTSPRRLKPLAELIRGHLARAPRRRLGTTERIWASLPWGNRDS